MHEKIAIRTASLIVAILGWLLVTALAAFIVWSLRDRARIIRDKDNEQIINLLFASLRGYDDFGVAIESHSLLKERITGFAMYDADFTPIYQWGNTPTIFDERLLGNRKDTPSEKHFFELKSFGRYMSSSPGERSTRVVFHTDRLIPRMPPLMVEENSPEENKKYSQTSAGSQLQKVGSRVPVGNTAQRVITIAPQEYFTLMISLAKGEYIYIDIIHPTFWITHIATIVFLPIWELAFLFLMWYIRRLYLRNHEYRERIEAQKNLVVLGTAASTLAHEIKNPLLSIRLQTGILKKLYLDGNDEVAIIDDEVERIAALIYRVNDYLREAEGNPVSIRIADFVNETSRRLCGRNIVSAEIASDALVSMDTERARSVFENIIRNALESGSNEADVGASIIRVGNTVIVNVFDRGKGIAEADLRRVFDPFFTKKSTGTGIGLAISKRFIEAVGGTIELANREGGGAVARITLPERKID
ncbi:MAG: HAMP domain-containing histidine kinase [Treponema sp.]|nr:HAMP domain-containing histidine kinase [Treponema sp.]